ncbi:hypothetical protein [Noviherbaspirillum saxi]|uniref:Uncharacterized protein n=1 Tax=Noviherbaspirillum saxi TaxID=2320863 RepID=A0A3A3FPW3_9BURK|nr:hypothetical protein [Noviherbaspirillum saxi]RJF97913.1 hypothetical protein D3871_04795 [Noviherbaspirillum saxi]
MSPAEIMKIIKGYEANVDASWTTMVREHARCLSSIANKLSAEELAGLIEVAAASYQKARQEYQASVEYDLLVLRLNAEAAKRQRSK